MIPKYVKFILSIFAFLFILDIVISSAATPANVDNYRFPYKQLVRQGILPDLEAQLILLPKGEMLTFELIMVKQVDLKTVDTALTQDGLITKAQRIEIVATLLKELADRDQKNILAYLEKQNSLGKVTKINSYAISNNIFVTASKEVIRELANRADVAIVAPNYEIHIVPQEGVTPENNAIDEYSKTTNCGLAKIRAQDTWAAGFNGNPDVIVANIDTGVRYTHHQLDSNWRSTNGWYDPVYGNITPNDSNGHGTATMGIMAGTNDADGNIIGVCPECSWVACRGIANDGSGDYNWLNGCADWCLLTSQPDVINNSWATSFGCSTTFEPKIEAWNTAGIWSSFAAGNWSVDCSPANLSPAFAVGNVDCSDNYAENSGQGPSDCDGTIFPEVCAPGAGTYTASNSSDSSYSYAGGTSASTPHVCGAFALIKDFNAELSCDQAKDMLKNSADDLGDLGPDNVYGWGRINIYEALALPVSIIDFKATKE